MECEENLNSCVCPSCGHLGSEIFCGLCGEKLKTDRITLPYIFDQWVDIYVGIDSGLPATLKNMLLAPGEFIKSYFEGKRIGFYKPMKFAMLLGSISVLTTILTTDEQFLQINDESDFFFKEFYTIVNKDISLIANIILIFQFPIAAYFTWKRNLKRGFTYGEHLYVNALIVGEVFALQIVSNFLKWLFKLFSIEINLDNYIGYLIPIYFAYVYSSWIHGKIRLPRFLKTVIGSGVLYVLSFLLAVLVCFLLIYIYTVLILRNNLI